MCEYCKQKNREEFLDEYDRYYAHITPVFPLRAINLTTGERATTVESPYFSLFIREDGEDCECGSFKIQYCPWCGEKLISSRYNWSLET